MRVLLQVVIGQGRDFDAALAERRDVQPDDVETVEEVFAEPPLRDEGLEVCIGSGDDADVGLLRLRLADRVHLARLEESEQLGLDVRSGFADFVEEQCAADRCADDAGKVVDGARKRAAPVAEQLRVEHVLGHAGAVEGEKGGVGPC